MRRNREAGQALVTAALTLTVLLLAAGLAIDMGYMRYQKRAMQTAADSAALAAAAEIDYGDLAAAAQADANLNGISVPSVDTTCPPAAPSAGTPTMCAQKYLGSSTPSLNVACLANYSCAEVTISQSVPTFFMRIAGISSERVSASAMAKLGPGTGCLYALGPNTTFTDSNGAGATFQADIDIDTQVYANSCAAMSAGSVGASGFSHELRTKVIGTSDAPNCTGLCSPIQFTPAPAQWSKIAAPPDPLAYLQSNIPGAGTPAACSHDCMPQPCGYNFCSLEGAGYSYPAGITIDDGANYTFQPGTYVVGNCSTCGLSISGGTGTVTGSGVTFYNSGTSTISINPPGTPYNSCTNSDVTVQLVAPSSGSYPGILFFQDAGDTQTMTVQLSNGTFCGGGAPDPATATTTESYALGAIYAPGATALMMGLAPAYAGNGCSYIPRFTLVVALDIRLGGADVNINVDDCDQPPMQYAGTLTLPPSPIKAAVLVE